MGFITCGPNEVLVVSGCCHKRPLLIPGGRAFVFKGLQRVQRLSLNTMTLQIISEHVYTKYGVPISVTGIAQVKVQGQNREMLQAACQQFLGKSEDDIRRVAQQTLEGHQRAIMAHMTVEDIYRDRKKFSKAVFEVASSDLLNMGISVVSYTLKDLHDQAGYLKALGKPRTAQVQRDARIGEAEARRDAGIKESLAEEQRLNARFSNDIEIAKAQRDYQLKQAAFDQDVQAQRAQAELAYSLQAAKTQQMIKEEQMQVQVIERAQKIQIQEQEIVRKERELESKIRKPAEAEKYRLEKLAEANRNRIILEAQAQASAVQMKGEAQAFAIEAKARAEADQMTKKAEAWKEYEEAAKVDMILQVLPKIAAEIAAPLSQVKKVTMISSGKGDIGAAKLTDEVLAVMENLPKVVEGMTGISITKTMAHSQRRG